MMKLKLEEAYSHLKLWYMCNMSRELDYFILFFFLILFVSILFSVSNLCVCYFRLLKFTLRKNRLNTVYTGDSIQQERLSFSLEVDRIYLQSLDLPM